MKVQYTPTKELKGVGFDFPFQFVANWYDYQKDFVNSLDLSQYNNTAMYTDKAKLSEVIVYKNKNVLREECTVELYGDKIVIDSEKENTLVLPFSEITAVSVLGKNKANIYHDSRVYQLKGSKRFNAIKYVNIYYRFKNISKGEEDGKFLGL